MTLVRRWWPVPAIIVTAIVVQTIALRGYTAQGHAAAHLSSAQVVFFGAAVVGIIMWSTPMSRRQLDVLLACAAWLTALAGVAVGNLRVVDAIGNENWTDEQADALGEGLRGFESGHDFAQVSAFLAIAAAIVLAVVLLIRHYIGRGVLIGSIALSIVFPYWIIPGAGVIVLAVALCIARGKRLAAAGAF
jgi:hypothetical protein